MKFKIYLNRPTSMEEYGLCGSCKTLRFDDLRSQAKQRQYCLAICQSWVGFKNTPTIDFAVLHSDIERKWIYGAVLQTTQKDETHPRILGIVPSQNETNPHITDMTSNSFIIYLFTALITFASIYSYSALSL